MRVECSAVRGHADGDAAATGLISHTRGLMPLLSHSLFFSGFLSIYSPCITPTKLFVSESAAIFSVFVHHSRVVASFGRWSASKGSPVGSPCRRQICCRTPQGSIIANLLKHSLLVHGLHKALAGCEELRVALVHRLRLPSYRWCSRRSPCRTIRKCLLSSSQR